MIWPMDEAILNTRKVHVKENSNKHPNHMEDRFIIITGSAYL